MIETSTDHIHTRRKEIRKEMAARLAEFVAAVPGVTHALLLSRDALPLVTSGFHRDYAAKWSAVFGSMTSMAENIPGRNGETGTLSQLIIERHDARFLLVNAGSSQHFLGQAGTRDGVVETALVVVCEPNAKMGAVGYETGLLVNRFAEYMIEPVRVR
ncbi:roadblock/LC7 domain-containing protein [Streptomyces sp. NPDC006335]|uniref:roadblock/LC7 domain-containing protein n=1 Tax=Streptomyces sp. NPDC006335 TaxID=3156895 RepID=UPI0033B5A366